MMGLEEVFFVTRFRLKRLDQGSGLLIILQHLHQMMSFVISHVYM